MAYSRERHRECQVSTNHRQVDWQMEDEKDRVFADELFLRELELGR